LGFLTQGLICSPCLNPASASSAGITGMFYHTWNPDLTYLRPTWLKIRQAGVVKATNISALDTPGSKSWFYYQ
jgi:hypothetical protein